MASIRLEGIRKTYPNGHVAARGIDLEIAEGELLVLVGPSGCGKSTLLRIVAGLETPTAGRVSIGGRDVTELPPQERDIAMVFQSYALYPHKSVRENLEFALRMRGVPRETSADRVERVAVTLGLDDLLDRKPRQLSGGQRQRVALGRALVREPKVFLFDEPLSNLDAKLRVQTRAELSRLHRRLGATMLYVTHDQEEAMTLGDRVAVLRDGVCLQVAPPMEIYNRPANAFVAGFIGSPSMNFLEARLQRRNGHLEVRGEAVTLPLNGGVRPRAGDETGNVWLGVRPQDLEVVANGGADVTARVDVIEPLGSELIVHLEMPGVREGSTIRVVAPPDADVEVDRPAGLRFRRDRLHLFDVRTETRLD